MELFRGIMVPNNSACSSNSSNNSSPPTTPSNVGLEKSPPPSPVYQSRHRAHPVNHHHSHHSHHSHSHHHNANITTTTASVIQPNPVNTNSRRQDNNTNKNFRPPYFPDETDLDQQLRLQNQNSSSTNNNTSINTTKGIIDTIDSNSTVIARRNSRTNTDLNSINTGPIMFISPSISNIGNDDLNDSFKSESSFPPGFSSNQLHNGLPGPVSNGSNFNGQASNNRSVEISSKYFLETECGDNLHLNGSCDLGDNNSTFNETDHSFPNQINAYESDVEIGGDCGIGEHND